MQTKTLMKQCANTLHMHIFPVNKHLHNLAQLNLNDSLLYLSLQAIVLRRVQIIPIVLI